MHSTGLPSRRAIAQIVRVIDTRASAVTVSRPSVTTNDFDEETETLTEHTEYAWLYEPDERAANEIAGERINGSLGALIRADGTVDLQRDDRITHGGVEYEIDSIVGHPEDDEPDKSPSPETHFWIVDMVRRQ